MAIKVKTFVGKCNMEGLHQMDDHINEWLKRNDVAIRQITQTFGEERFHGGNSEPVVITSVWHDVKDDF